MDCGFVVLHYKAYDMTEQCVNTLIKTFNHSNIHIVVVDNGSGDFSGDRIKKQFAGNPQVNVLINEENLGFAKGNNVGYRFLKDKYKPDFIVVMNNDVLIKDSLFIEKINNIYIEKKFDVLGPDIQNPILNNHQNPIRLKPRSLNEIIHRYKVFCRKCFFPRTCYFLSLIKSKIIKKKKLVEKEYYLTNHENPLLHGACVILSNGFMRARDYCFNPKTFLYHEEDIFHQECLRLKLKMVYSPKVYVEHLEDVATNASFSSEIKKYIMRNQWLRDSSKILIDILEEEC